MVVGTGMVARRFGDYVDNDAVLVFASGVSNSKSTNPADYQRELSLLENTIENHPNKTLVYFSTTSVYDPSERSSDYVLHKLKLEAYIEANAASYLIFRVSNLVGKSVNNNTVLNFFLNSLKEGSPFNLWVDASRNLIDVDDFYKVVNHIITNRIFENEIVNIANPHNYKVVDIIYSIEQFLGKKANFTAIHKGSDYPINILKIRLVFAELSIIFGKDYLANLLEKYYSGNDL